MIKWSLCIVIKWHLSIFMHWGRYITFYCVLGILCPDGSKVTICGHLCENTTCATMPEAVCIPDTCTCEPKFYHPDKMIAVKCDESKIWPHNNCYNGTDIHDSRYVSGILLCYVLQCDAIIVYVLHNNRSLKGTQTVVRLFLWNKCQDYAPANLLCFTFFGVCPY